MRNLFGKKREGDTQKGERSLSGYANPVTKKVYNPVTGKSYHLNAEPSSGKKNWDLNIRIGTKGMQVVCPAGKVNFDFPAYVYNLGKEPAEEDYMNCGLFYRNEKTNEIWIIGEEAKKRQEEKGRDPFDPERYSSEPFRVLMEIGMGMGILLDKDKEQKTGNLRIKIEVPIKSDQEEAGYAVPVISDEEREQLEDLFAGKHSFFIQIGSGTESKARSFSFNVEADQIKIEKRDFVLGKPSRSIYYDF